MGKGIWLLLALSKVNCDFNKKVKQYLKDLKNLKDLKGLKFV
jgi:hypothetical protein